MYSEEEWILVYEKNVSQLYILLVGILFMEVTIIDLLGCIGDWIS